MLKIKDTIIGKFKDENALNSYSSLMKSRLKAGDLVYLENSSKYKIFNGTDWQQYDEFVPMSANTNMTLYDFNKAMYSKIPPLEDRGCDIKKIVKMINGFKPNKRLFFLMCKDINYITVIQKKKKGEFINLGTAVIQCLKNVGDLIDIEIDADQKVEIWIKKNSEIFCFLLFDSEDFFVSCGG